MRALYLDSSAFVKLVVEEPESAAVRSFLANRSARRVSSALLRTESLRAVRHLGPDALATIREGLRRVDLIGIDDRILDAAGILEPQVLRTLDAIHLATAMAVGDDLEAIVTYDQRMVDAARWMGLATATPR
ncbi:MAG TPA: type II toxin-antitoxin system VapC family toxin [Candidatus Saccharimonadales bacterium]|nr:type II toxin-antitoxin system VapC family toxin [Candidatus Saccharimonadales bacterium]